jgi:hypothetical protein
VIPTRSATESFLAAGNRTLQVSFDIDLGELMPGHHVVARGIERGQPRLPPSGSSTSIEELDRLHYEHVPGLTKVSATPYWGFTITDDVGTEYVDDESGAFDWQGGGPATHGFRNLGRIPSDASLLTLTIHPSREWVPPEPWRRKLIIDLVHGAVVG